MMEVTYHVSRAALGNFASLMRMPHHRYPWLVAIEATATLQGPENGKGGGTYRVVVRYEPLTWTVW